jgi:hypothetical protein
MKCAGHCIISCALMCFCCQYSQNPPLKKKGVRISADSSACRIVDGIKTDWCLMSPARLQVSNAPAGIRVRMPVTSRDDVPHHVLYYNTKKDLSTIIFHYVNPALFILTNRLSFVSALAGFFPQIRAAGTCFEPFFSDVPYLYTKRPVCRIIQQTSILYSIF